MIASTHNHSTGSDGKLTPEEVIKKAISLGWDYIYFTDHYFPHPKNHKVKKKYFFRFGNNYIQEIKKLKEEYSDKINVYFGVELDWFEEYKNWTKEQSKKHDFDYILGSIHRLPFNEKYVDMEPGKENWIKNVKEFGGVKKFVKEYYLQIRNITKSGIFDAIGHLDYIKVYNKNNEFFSEEEDWYKKEILECLDLMEKNKISLEINHSGIRKCNMLFPSEWIIEKAKKRNIPITLGLDAHYEEDYNNNYLNDLINIAKKAGYHEVIRFEKRKIIKEPLK